MLNIMKNLFVLVLCIIRFSNTFAGPVDGMYRLDLIHFNDFHARFEETSVATPTCRYNNNSCIGGFARLYYQINELFKQKPDAILLNAGDSFQGTYYYTAFKWDITQQFMNYLSHDAHAIGNHEFDDGPTGLAPYLATLKSAVVAANIDASKEPVLEGLFTPHVVVERQGRKIGIIGVITEDTKTLSSTGKVKFSDPLKAVEKEAEFLNKTGVDIIIVLSHCGLNVDKEIAKKYGHLVDIVVGGHSHSLLWNGPTSPSGDKVEGPYPVVLQSDEGQLNALVVQASAFTKYLGNISVYFDCSGEVVSWEGDPIFLNRSIAQDQDILEKLKPFTEQVHEVEDRKVGENNRFLNSDDCVFGECALGDIIVDAFKEQAQNVTNSKYKHLAFIQRGNIKSSILEGEVKFGTVMEVLPYRDRVQTFEMQGKFIRQALERSVSSAWATDPFKGPYVLQVSGLKVSYNISQPEGERILNVTIDSDCDQQLELGTYYQVTCSVYLATGGDGFTMFKRKRNVKNIGYDQEILGAYITENSPLNKQKEGRITILY